MLGNTNASNAGDVTNSIQSNNGSVIKLLKSLWITSTNYPGYYENTIATKSITTQVPEVTIYPETTAVPTDTEIKAFSLLKNVVGDADTNQLVFLASAIPAVDFCVHVKGVTFTGNYQGISENAQFQQTVADLFDSLMSNMSNMNIPDYDNKVALVSGTAYTCPSNGVIVLYANGPSTSQGFCQASIGGIMFCANTWQSASSGNSVQVTVGAGTPVINLSILNGNAWFIPFKTQGIGVTGFGTILTSNIVASIVAQTESAAYCSLLVPAGKWIITANDIAMSTRAILYTSSETLADIDGSAMAIVNFAEPTTVNIKANGASDTHYRCWIKAVKIG